MKLYKSPEHREQLARDIDKVCIWLLEDYGVDVIIDTEGANDYDHESRLVTISSKTNLFVRLHTLLHEAAHAVLRHDYDAYRSKFEHAGVYDRRWSYEHRVDVIREEVLAWDLGETIAENLGIELDTSKYYLHARRALLTYLSIFNTKKFLWQPS
jgi:hypothetical protein